MSPNTLMIIIELENKKGIFSVCAPPSIVGAYYLRPQTQLPYYYIMIHYVLALTLYLGGS